MVVEDGEGHHQRREHGHQSYDRIATLHVVLSSVYVLTSCQVALTVEQERLELDGDAQ